MKTSIYKYILNFPENIIRKIRYISIILFFLFLIIERNHKFGLETTFLLITPIIWIGGGFIFLWFFVKYLSLKRPNTITHKFILFACILFIFILFVGPVFCYCMAKYYEWQGNYYRELYHL